LCPAGEVTNAGANRKKPTKMEEFCFDTGRTTLNVGLTIRPWHARSVPFLQGPHFPGIE
jgi:hypothetical protein